MLLEVGMTKYIFLTLTEVDVKPHISCIMFQAQSVLGPTVDLAEITKLIQGIHTIPFCDFLFNCSSPNITDTTILKC